MMGRLGIIAAMAFAMALVTFGVIVPARGQTVDTDAHLTPMVESATAMQDAGRVLQAHSQMMLDEGVSLGDEELLAPVEYWFQDAQPLAQGGQWT